MVASETFEPTALATCVSRPTLGTSDLESLVPGPFFLLPQNDPRFVVRKNGVTENGYAKYSVSLRWCGVTYSSVQPADVVLDETEMRHDTPSSDYHVDGGLGASRDEDEMEDQAQATMQWVEDVFVFLRAQAHEAGATEKHICWLLTHAVPYPANMRERSLPLHMHWSRMLYLFV